MQKEKIKKNFNAWLIIITLLILKIHWILIIVALLQKIKINAVIIFYSLDSIDKVCVLRQRWNPRTCENPPVRRHPTKIRSVDSTRSGSNATEEGDISIDDLTVVHQLKIMPSGQTKKRTDREDEVGDDAPLLAIYTAARVPAATVCQCLCDFWSSSRDVVLTLGIRKYKHLSLEGRVAGKV